MSGDGIELPAPTEISRDRVVAASGGGRNAPSPCGSGKRYKFCCGAAAPATSPTDISALLQRALAEGYGAAGG